MLFEECAIAAAKLLAAHIEGEIAVEGREDRVEEDSGVGDFLEHDLQGEFDRRRNDLSGVGLRGWEDLSGC